MFSVLIKHIIVYRTVMFRLRVSFAWISTTSIPSSTTRGREDLSVRPLHLSDVQETQRTDRQTSAPSVRCWTQAPYDARWSSGDVR